MGSKFLFTGDLHGGVRGNHEIFLTSLEDSFDKFIIPLAKKEKVKDIKILGDILDSRSILNLKIQRRMIELFKKLSSFDVTIILGNHDLYYKNRKDVIGCQFLGEIFDNVEIISQITERKEAEKKVLYLPWLCVEDEIKQAVKLLKKNEYDICMGHITINSFAMVKNILERNGFPPDLFKNCGRVYSGHFHIRSEKGNIIYVGSPYQTNWADEGNTKGVYIQNLKTGQRTFYENKFSPTFQKLYTESINAETDFNEWPVRGNFVRIVVNTKISDAEVTQIYNKIQGYGPLNIDVENISEDFLSDKDNHYSLADLKNTFDFLAEYVDNLQVPDGINKSELINYLKGLHQRCEEK